MNTSHLTETITKLWPGKLNDDQVEAIVTQCRKMQCDEEQVTAACQRVLCDPPGKMTLAARIVAQLHQASSPNTGMVTNDAQRSYPDDLRVACGYPADWSADMVVLTYHTDMRDKAISQYGRVPWFSISLADQDLRQWVCEHEESVPLLIADLFGEDGVEFNTRRRAIRQKIDGFRKRIESGECTWSVIFHERKKEAEIEAENERLRVKRMREAVEKELRDANRAAAEHAWKSKAGRMEAAAAGGRPGGD